MEDSRGVVTTGVQGVGHGVVDRLSAVVGVVLAAERIGVDHLHVGEGGGTEEAGDESGGAHFGSWDVSDFGGFVEKVEEDLTNCVADV